MKVKILSGTYRGETGVLSYDDEGFAWIVVSMMGMTRDIAANSVTYEEVACASIPQTTRLTLPSLIGKLSGGMPKIGYPRTQQK